ncbi:MAG: twin-arginine translocase TatA/TatE family subunit [Bdellovibrionales bacterium]|nr:twin-arginine translocase TatA/TatE family subunit [Bdellovibrionales bacterium]
MFGIGMGELLVIAILGLILIGPEQLPDLARTIGRFINDLKRSTEGLTDDLKKQARVDFDLMDSINSKPRRPFVEDEFKKIIQSPEEKILPKKDLHESSGHQGTVMTHNEFGELIQVESEVQETQQEIDKDQLSLFDENDTDKKNSNT